MTEENVQEKPVSEETTSKDDQPSMEEQVAKAVSEQVEQATRKMQSEKDKAIFEIQREAGARAKLAESTLTSYEASLEGMGADPVQAEVAKLRARDQFHSQRESEYEAQRQNQATIDSFESTMRQHITDLGIDPNNSKIEWGDKNSMDLLERQRAILSSASKLQKENAKVADEERKEEFDKFKRETRKDLGLDSVDTTISPSGDDSDAEFKKGIGDGTLPLNKTNMERVKKLGLA